jgi:hypothetical protein
MTLGFEKTLNDSYKEILYPSLSGTFDKKTQPLTPEERLDRLRQKVLEHGIPPEDPAINLNVFKFEI